MMRGLIGATGFIGRNLQSQISFDSLFNSKNIREIQDQKFDELYCCAAPGSKWFANQNPELDWESISNLIEHLKRAKCQKLILISTVDVYGNVGGGHTELDSIWPNLQSAYGKHRWKLEEFVRERFDSLVIRLPLLFGLGLKKNVLFDLIHQERLDKINPQDTHQWYPLSRLGSDIDKVLEKKLSTLNLVSEPILLSEIIQGFFGTCTGIQERESHIYYDTKSAYASVFDGERGYALSKAEIIKELLFFLSGKGLAENRESFREKNFIPVSEPDLKHTS